LVDPKEEVRQNENREAVAAKSSSARPLARQARRTASADGDARRDAASGA
jgi:hypothetical protein